MKNYINEIDSLRCMAVMSVILYHSQLKIFGYNFFSGGAIGVDIFFVISGFVITRIIVHQIVEVGSFSIINFYNRRILRILPALIIVLLITLAFSYFKFLPSYYVEIAKSTLSSLYFYSNFFFYNIGTQYEASVSLVKPLLHTWSLSIEEQFYLLIPIIFMIIKKDYLKKLFKFFFYLFLISLIFFIYKSLMLLSENSVDQQMKIFYFTHYRIFEILTGCILAIKKISFFNKKNFFSFLGFTGIFFYILFYENLNLINPIYKVIPLIGTALIINNIEQKDIINKILNFPVFRWIGLISYSIYLWHFPIFAFLRIQLESLSNLEKIFGIFATIVISYLTYILIENPFRNKSYNDLKKYLILIILYLIITLFSLNIINNNGYTNRFEKLENYYTNNIVDNAILRKQSWKYLNPNPPKFEKQNTIKVLFIGDSHSKDMFNVFYLNKELFYNFEFSRIGSDTKNDFQFGRDNVDKLINDPNFLKSDYIVISDRFSKNELSHLPDIIDFLKNKQKKIILMSNSPEFEVKYAPLRTQYDLLLEQHFLKKIKIKETEFKSLLERKMFLNRDIKSYEQINKKLKIISQKKSIIFLNKEDFICNSKIFECDALTNENKKIFYDYGHYTIEGAKYFGEKIYQLNWFKIN